MKPVGRRFLAGVTAIIAATMPTISAGRQADVRSVPFRKISEAGTALDGVWQAQGYGWVAEISNGKPTIYNLAGRLCQRDQQGGVVELLGLFRQTGPATVEFTPAPNETTYHFTRIKQLPATCHAPPPLPGAFIAATFDAYYPGFVSRGIDRKSFLTRLKATDRLANDKRFDALAAALGSLSDAHVELALSHGSTERSFQGGESRFLASLATDVRYGDDPSARQRVWLSKYRSELLTLLGPTGKLAANNRIFWGKVGNLGYINIVTMGGFEQQGDATRVLDETLDQAIGTFAGLPGVIVDISNNRGGYDSIGRHIAARFAARPTTIYSKRGYAANAPFQRFTVAPPTSGPTYSGPVWLVTSEITVSAGESFTLAMRALPNVVHVGARTRGDLSDKVPKHLAGGWSFSLSAETYRDTQGVSWEGRGIPPKRAYPISLHEHAGSIRSLADDITDGRLKQ